MWKNKESYIDQDGVFGLSIIKYVTLQKIVAHDFRYFPRTFGSVRLILTDFSRRTFYELTTNEKNYFLITAERIKCVNITKYFYCTFEP